MKFSIQHVFIEGRDLIRFEGEVTATDFVTMDLDAAERAQVEAVKTASDFLELLAMLFRKHPAHGSMQGRSRAPNFTK